MAHGREERELHLEMQNRLWRDQGRAARLTVASVGLLASGSSPVEVYTLCAKGGRTAGTRSGLWGGQW